MPPLLSQSLSKEQREGESSMKGKFQCICNMKWEACRDRRGRRHTATEWAGEWVHLFAGACGHDHVQRWFIVWRRVWKKSITIQICRAQQARGRHRMEKVTQNEGWVATAVSASLQSRVSMLRVHRKAPLKRQYKWDTEEEGEEEESRSSG